MLVIRMHKSYATRTQLIIFTVDRKLDGPFPNKPHLGVHMMVRSVRRAASRQGSLVNFQGLP